MSNYFSLETTEDGSSTLYFPEYGENTHTIHGAYTEALYKHILPSGILERGEAELTILDIGFGLGYNLLALLCNLDISCKKSVRIFSFEKEKAIAPFLEQLKLEESQKEPFRWIKEAFNQGIYLQGSLEIHLLWGDARQQLASLLPQEEGRISAVFHDPHSPGKNSELWTVEFFSLLHRLMDSEARLTTYSFAQQVRGGLAEAGFHLAPFRSEVFQKEGTLAGKSPLPGERKGAPLTALLEEIKSTPYHDNREMNLERETIRLNRVEEMAARRKKGRSK